MSVNDRIGGMAGWAARAWFGARRAGARLPALLAVLVVAVFTPAHSTPSAAPQGPGAPVRSFSPGAIGTPIAALPAALPNGVLRYEHGQPVFFGGYLLIPISQEKMLGGFQIYDIEEPTYPKLVATHESVDLRETHNIGFYIDGDRRFAAFPAAFGIQIWDMSQLDRPSLITRLSLPGIMPSDYTRPAWWVSWQAPWIYVAGASQGLYVVDARDPYAPRLAAVIPVEQLGLARIGSIHPVGNLLVASVPEGYGVATIDISDAERPKLLATDTRFAVYSTNVAGDRIYGAGIHESSGLLVWDITDPLRLSLIAAHPEADRAAYLSIQDGDVHLGTGRKGYAKYPSTGGPPLVRYRIKAPGSDLDFTLPIGNLVVVADDRGHGSRIVIHDSEPDRSPPSVTMAYPRDGSVDVDPRTRVGVVFSDQIDLRSLRPDAFRLVDSTGAAIPALLSGQGTIVNAGAAASLPENEVITLVIAAGGLRDISGNEVATDIRVRFRTGSLRRVNRCAADRPVRTFTGEEAVFALRCEQPATETAARFGDGTEVKERGPVRHLYQQPGRFSVQLSSPDGGAVTFIHTVVNKPTAAPPARSQRLLLDEAGGRIFSANKQQGSVSRFSLEPFKRRKEADVCREPSSIALTGAGELWVSCTGDDRLLALEPQSLVLVGEIRLPKGSRPAGLVFAADGTKGYAALEGAGQIAEIDAHRRAISRTAEVGPRPRGLALTADGDRLYVTRFISPDEQGEIYPLDLASFTAEPRISLRFDPGPDSAISGRGVPNYLQSATISPDGTVLAVPSKKDNISRGLSRDGLPLNFENTVRAIVSFIDTATGREIADRRKDLDNRALPTAVAFSPAGDILYVATSASNTVEALDAVSGETLVSIERAGRFPVDLSIDSEGHRLYVLAEVSREIIAYDIRPVGRDNRIIRLGSDYTSVKDDLDPIERAGESIFHDSSDRRMSQNGYMSCAVCHLEGEDDGRVWDFTQLGEGLRNTASLVNRGGTLDGPLHWTANADEIEDFERQIRTLFGGSGFLRRKTLSDDLSDMLGPRRAEGNPELQAVRRFLRRLDHRTGAPPDEPAPELVRGKDLFMSAETGCATCHPPPSFSDSRFEGKVPVLHDVGTIGQHSGSRLGAGLVGIDTPSLRGVGRTPPYLHDGSASSIEDVLTARNRDDRHGRTSHLTPQQISDLARFIRTIE